MAEYFLQILVNSGLITKGNPFDNCVHTRMFSNYEYPLINTWAPSSVVGWGTVLQARRSLDRVPIRWIFSIFNFQFSSLTRGWVCRLQLPLVLAIAVILRSKSRGTHDHILLSQVWDSPNLEGQVPVFISPMNRLAQLYPQALGSLFVTSCDSQGYSGGIGPFLHAGGIYVNRWNPMLYTII
jgi:hypothetical protein